MSRKERRRDMRKAQDFVPKKSKALPRWVIIALGLFVALFFVATRTIQYS